MSFGTIFPVALGLAMDATAVAGARGMAVRRIRPRHVWLVAGLFGGFQALMPVRRFGAMLGKRLDVLGGLVPIGIAVKLLLDHTVAGAEAPPRLTE